MCTNGPPDHPDRIFAPYRFTPRSAQRDDRRRRRRREAAVPSSHPDQKFPVPFIHLASTH